MNRKPILQTAQPAPMGFPGHDPGRAGHDPEMTGHDRRNAHERRVRSLPHRQLRKRRHCCPAHAGIDLSVPSNHIVCMTTQVDRGSRRVLTGVSTMMTGTVEKS